MLSFIHFSILIPLLILGCSACSGRALTRAGCLGMARQGHQSLSLCESSKPVPRSCCLHLLEKEHTKADAQRQLSTGTPDVSLEEGAVKNPWPWLPQAADKSRKLAEAACGRLGAKV